MGRVLRFLSSVMVAGCVLALPLWAQSTTMKIVTDADCLAEACTVASPAQFCRESAAGPIFVCDTVAGFYVPTPGFSSADCSLESCNAAGVLGQTCVDPAGRWECDGAGSFYIITPPPLTFTVCQTCKYSTVQSGIDTAEAVASPAQPVRVWVAPGTYSENVHIGSTGDPDEANIALEGASRDSVIIDGGVAGAAITIHGGKTEVRNLTATNAYILGWAIVTEQEHVTHVLIDNVNAVCTGQGFAIGCVAVRAVLSTGLDHYFELRNSLIKATYVGLQLTDPGRQYTRNNRIVMEGITHAGEVYGVWKSGIAPGDEYIWISDNDYVSISRTTATGTPTTIGVRLQIATATNDTYIHGPTIIVTDSGAATGGTISGIQSNSTAGSSDTARVYDADISVNRNASTGATYGAANTSTSAHQLRLYGGRIRAQNSNSTDVELFQSGGGILNVSGVDYASSSGSITAIDSRVGRFDLSLDGPDGDCCPGTCTIGQTFVDTGGATDELCACVATNTWSCVALAAGPAEKCFHLITDPIAVTDEWVVRLPPFTGTMTRFDCESYSGTSFTVDICDGEDIGDDTCTTSILGAPLVCGTAGASDTTLTNPGFVARDKVSIVITAESGTPVGDLYMTCTALD